MEKIIPIGRGARKIKISVSVTKGNASESRFTLSFIHGNDHFQHMMIWDDEIYDALSELIDFVEYIQKENTK